MFYVLMLTPLGTDGPTFSIDDERAVISEPIGACVTYNQHRNLSIQQQRQQLPVFSVCCLLLHACFIHSRTFYEHAFHTIWQIVEVNSFLNH